MALFVALLAVVVVLLLVLAAASTLRYDTWRRKGVPHPRPLPLFGNTLRFALQREPLHLTLDRLYHQFPGKGLVGFYAGPSPVLLIKDVNIVKDITVKDFQIFSNHKLSPDPMYDKTFSKFLFCLRNDEWKTTRQKLTPAFSSGRLKAMYPSVREIGQHFVKSIRDNLDENGNMSVGARCSRYGIDVTARTAFGCEANSLTERDPPPYMQAVAEAFRLGPSEGLATFTLLFVPMLYHALRLPLLREWRATVLKGLLRQACEHREREPPRNMDIFDTLLQLKRNGDVSPEVFEAQVMAMQVAGSETSASMVTFTLWQLARYPECQDKVRKEMQETVAKNGGEIDFDTLHDLRYLERVYKETLRLWPVMPWLDRVASEDYEIPGTDVKIEKGTTIFIPTYSLQRDPEHFEDPTGFRPDRWASESNSPAYMPFGSGQRSCIGKRFADMSVKSAVAQVVLNYRVSLTKDTPRTEDEVTHSPMSFLIVFKNDIKLHFDSL